MNKTNLKLIFEGPAVKNGEIDVEDLAPTLVAIDNLLKTTNREINGNNVEMSVKVSATHKGSFEVVFNLLQSFLENPEMLIDRAESICDAVKKVYSLIKFLKGKMPDKVTPKEDGKVIVHRGKDTLVTDQRTIQLSKNHSIKERAKKSVDSLSKEGIDNIKIRLSDSEEVNINKHEREYFEFEETEEPVYTRRNARLQIISLSFKESNQWQFTDTDGDKQLRATIEDADFLDKIAKNEAVFLKGDYLNCIIREKQPSKSNDFKKENSCSIIKVTAHKHPPKQMPLI
ncbi:MAG: hypothetical protein ACR2NQ_03590 [Thermodesulfobacteriota bacterium]